MYNVILWGLGVGYNIFTSCHGHSKVNVVGVTDSQGLHYKSFDGKPVLPLKDVFKKVIKYDYLIITVMDNKTYKEIVTEAVSNGVDRDIVLPLRIFQIPFFDFEEYIKIKQSNISILSDYCFAGLLYHNFGLRFNSPTINMYTENDNYIKFLSDVERYMKLPMEEVENIVDEPYLGTYALPRGRVGDVEWKFNHDITFDTAAERWSRGIGRFNSHNFIAVMTIRSEEMAYRFNELPIKYKMGFYWKELGLDSVVCLPQWENEKFRAKFGYNFSELVNAVAYENAGIRAIDWMKALQHKEGYVRVF